MEAKKTILTYAGLKKLEEELEHLLKSYEIGEKIIKNNYFGRE